MKQGSGHGVRLWTLKPVLVTFHPAIPYLNLPKHCHQLGSKHSNIWVYEVPIYSPHVEPMVPTTIFNSSSRGVKCMHVHALVSMCVHVCDVLMRVSIPPLWHYLIPLKYGLSLDLIQSSCFSASLAFSRPFLSLGSSVLELQASRDYSQCCVVLESEVWFLYLCIVHSNHRAISPIKSLWLENALYFCLLH